ncbi:MAG: CocE/NonD family hydrolase [Solirubrobacterales bacterium]|nr:CocE/NonD family hydrolase [Solirubrobacterales bacterium]
MPSARVVLLSLLAFAAAAGPAVAAPPALPPATYKTISEYRTIAMDDGVELGATITYPSVDGTTRAPGQFPVVLSMTPYGRDGLCGCPLQTVYSSRGFVQAVVDVRGTGGSGGNLDGNYFSPREQRDGYELVEWFGTQPWSNGKVGMSGGSYVGITQYLTAELQPPHLAAIAPTVALSDLYRDAYTFDGVPDIFFDGQYIAVQGGPGVLSGNVGEPGDSGANADADPSHLPGAVQSTAAAKAGQAQGTPILFDYLQRPDDDPWYHDRSPYYGVDRITVPTLINDGWRDGAFVRGDLEMFRRLSARPGVETRAIVGPCTHKGCGAPFYAQGPSGVEDTQGYEFEFLSHYLRGTDEPPRPAVHYFVQGANRYADAAQWPPAQAELQKLYLQPGKLTEEPPAPAAESYFTNPTAGLSMSLNSYGTIAASPYVPTDQRLEDEQGLTWRTAPYATATRLAGPLALHLVASSTATDTDWVARLSDVAPDGSETVITEGALRASHRALDLARSTPGSPYHVDRDTTPLTPDQVYAFDVAIIPTAHELAPGHRLQLRLTTDDMATRFPGTIAFDRNDPAATKLVPLSPATNTVRDGGADPSHLLVPVLPGD